MISEAEGRLAAILRRELSAADVQFARADDAPVASDLVLSCTAANGLVVTAHFDEPPADREAKSRRMEMIVASFEDLLSAASPDAARHKHAPPARSLAGELSALAGRAGALSALVVDARSPVIWGVSDVYDAPSADADDTAAARVNFKAAEAGLRFAALVSDPLVDIGASGRASAPSASNPRLDIVVPSHAGADSDADSGPDDIDESGGFANEQTTENLRVPEDAESEVLTPEERAEFWRRVLLVRNALGAVRALPHVANLHKGEHLHESVRAPELSYVVRSFATIYMLVLVFDRVFDELRAERSVAHALPTIERLVLALPPTEPTPPVAGAGVMRMRRR